MFSQADYCSTFSQYSLICHFSSFFSVANIIGDSMSTVFFYQLLFCAINTAFFLFVIESCALFSLSTLVCFVGISSVLVPAFFFCKLSENVTFELEVIGDSFYDCSWYCLSVKQQKLFILVIGRSQKATRMNGLGIIQCSLGVFTSVSL